MKLLITSIALLFSVTSLTNLDINKDNKTINSFSLNYDDSLGKFQDLTSDEVKSYYSSLNNKSNLKLDSLVLELQNITKEGHTQISNSQAWNTNWNYFLLIDRNYEEDPLTKEEISSQKWKMDNVVVNPLYTDDITWEKSEKRYFDREHVWPKSRGFKDKYDTSENKKEQPYAATDMHNLRMGESTNNQQGHNNRPYGEVVTVETEIKSKYTNEVTGYLGLNKDGIEVYEPRDEDKGDIARSLFYMAARYSSYIDTETFQPALKLVSSFSSNKEATSTITCDSTKTTPATYGMLDDLLAWNELDPVDNFEKHRNNLVYNFVQGNRNPFIDYPSWANLCFDPTYQGTLDLNTESGVSESNTISYTLNSIDDYLNKSVNDVIATITYTDSEGVNHNLTLNDVNISIYKGDELISKSKDYVFTSTGNYKIVITYDIEEGTLETSLLIEVKEKTFVEKYYKYIAIGVSIIVVLIIILSIIVRITSKKNKRRKKKNK